MLSDRECLFKLRGTTLKGQWNGKGGGRLSLPLTIKGGVGENLVCSHHGLDGVGLAAYTASEQHAALRLHGKIL